MSGSEEGKVILGWWASNIEPRTMPAARALAARLRRASDVEALCEPEVINLARKLDLRPQNAQGLAYLVCLLAAVRSHSPQSLATVLGGPEAEARLSRLRFQRLMRAEDQELFGLMRRALQMADYRCNVAALGTDLLFWGPSVRARWCFEYFGADAPSQDSQETAQ